MSTLQILTSSLCYHVCLDSGMNIYGKRTVVLVCESDYFTTILCNTHTNTELYISIIQQGWYQQCVMHREHSWGYFGIRSVHCPPVVTVGNCINIEHLQ